MTSSSNNPKKGDTIAPPLQQQAQTLSHAAELADCETAALDTPNKGPASQSTNMAHALQAFINKVPVTSCRQNIWISIFFDGTGNNMDADTPTNEHSNVVRLYRVMPKDDRLIARYRIYVPGIGTYFKEIGDPGNTDRGMGFGAMGQARLDWATMSVEETLAPHLARANNRSNAIDEINIAVFGFSRGATAARAFVRDFIKRKCLQQNNHLTLNNGGWPVRFRFLGLFDTVASVGLPMSTNNVASVRTRRLAAANVLRASTPLSPYLRAVDLAFGAPGADPSPGSAHGHASWADDLRIPAAVEQCVHFVAAHEIRNSFPVDSVFYQGERPANCREMIYPGVHSDVGGGYRPGEEGKGGAPKSRTLVAASSSQMLSQFPLRGMYDLALAAGVPLLAQTAWTEINKNDFELDPDLAQLITYYMDAASWGGTPMGVQLNQHMALYFAWRFAKIRRKRAGDHSEGQRIMHNEALFQREFKELEKQVGVLSDQYSRENLKVAQVEQQYQHELLGRYGNPRPDGRQSVYLDKLEQAKRSRDEAKDAYLSVKAQLDTMPSIGRLSKNIAELDEQLMSDAQDIHQACQQNREKRKQLRPHYKVLLDAYENEFLRHQGLKDEKIFAFFELQVHESLADFYKDSTLPSDPRVVYFGGNEKYKYALNVPKDWSDEGAA